MNYYVYKFLNEDGEILYIGRTTNIFQCIQTQSAWCKKPLWEEKKKIEYVEFSSEADMEVYALYLINRYKPKYNVSNKFAGELTFDIEEGDWCEYIKRTPLEKIMSRKPNNDDVMTNPQRILEWCNKHPKEKVFNISEMLKETGLTQMQFKKIKYKSPAIKCMFNQMKTGKKGYYKIS